MGTSTDVNTGFSLKIKNGMANSVDPDETARYEPSHLDLHCLHRYLFWSAWFKWLCDMLSHAVVPKGLETLVMVTLQYVSLQSSHVLTWHSSLVFK